MNPIYLDNAATTPVLPEVTKVIVEAMNTVYGNPSSVHQVGRKARTLIETARKNIAKHFQVSAHEILFTSGGSEADNLILHNAVENLGISTIISSKIEHHAVVKTIEKLQEKYKLKVHWLSVATSGEPDYKELASLLSADTSKKLVSLMYINNEVGTILDVQQVSDLCVEHGALFHSDAVQAVGHFPIDLSKTPIDFMAASAHKFHGPKGVGFAYIKKGYGIKPLLTGGEQEGGARAGTENVPAILGMEKALEISYEQLDPERTQIQELKDYFVAELRKNFNGVCINGAEDPAKGSYLILNVRFPKSYAMLLFSLDLKGIAASGGSACQSGSSNGSHVLNEMLNKEEASKTSIRFSFSKFNTVGEIDQVIAGLKTLL
ncbi:MAG: cysteine desulfurase family protein [Lutibacter sp.]|jgi:cysteine desulfurase|nr:cysteine desulfurase family protein [Lutibacter sp.]